QHNQQYVQRKTKLEVLIRTFDDFDNDQAMRAMMRAEINKSASMLNIGNGPTMILAVFRGGNGDHIFVVVHHLVIDGVSWRVLIEDFQTLLTQKANAQTLKLPERSDSFLEWSESLRRYAQGDALHAELPYWL